MWRWWLRERLIEKVEKRVPSRVKLYGLNSIFFFAALGMMHEFSHSLSVQNTISLDQDGLSPKHMRFVVFGS